MTTLADLDRPAKALADARNTVWDIVADLNAGMDALKRDAMPQLKAAVKAAAEKHDKLLTLIAENPQLFERPKSVVMHGLKLGFRKGVGGLEFDDAEQVVKLIRKHFPDRFDLLVEVTEKPLKTPLAQLSVAELKKLGITVEATGDEVFIKATDSGVDKLVKALLKSATDTTEA